MANEELLVVELKEGKGNYKFFSPEKTRAEVTNLLERARVLGKFFVTAGKGIRGSDQAEKFTFGSLENNLSIKLKDQLESKNSRQIIYLSIPEQYQKDPAPLVKMIREALEPEKKSQGRGKKKMPVNAKPVISEEDMELLKLAVIEVFTSTKELEKEKLILELQKHGFEFSITDALDQLIVEGIVVCFRSGNMLKLANAQPEEIASPTGFSQNDHFVWLKSVGEKAKKQNDLQIELHYACQEQDKLMLEQERIKAELQNLEKRKEELLKDIEALGDAKDELNQIKETLGIS